MHPFNSRSPDFTVFSVFASSFLRSFFDCHFWLMLSFDWHSITIIHYFGIKCIAFIFSSKTFVERLREIHKRQQQCKRWWVKKRLFESKETFQSKGRSLFFFHLLCLHPAHHWRDIRRVDHILIVSWWWSAEWSAGQFPALLFRWWSARRRMCQCYYCTTCQTSLSYKHNIDVICLSLVS